MAQERNLQELEDTLWAAFDVAHKHHKSYKNVDEASQTHPTNFCIENRKAMGELAQGIAAVRRERRVEQLTKEQQLLEEEMDKGLKSGVTLLNPIKLKQSDAP